MKFFCFWFFDRFQSNAGIAWMISIALWLQKCKFKINSIWGLNLRLTEMNALRNHLERQRPAKYRFSDLVKSKWDWMQSSVKPVFSQFGASRRPTLPPSCIYWEKFNISSFKFSFILKSFVLSYISKIFRHQKYWHTNPIRIMNVADIILSQIQNKISVLFSEGNIFPFQYCVQSRILVFVGWNDVILIFLWSLFSKSIEIFRKYMRGAESLF